MGTLPCYEQGERGEPNPLSLLNGPLRLPSLQLVPWPEYLDPPGETGPSVCADGVRSSITLMRSPFRFLLQSDYWRNLIRTDFTRVCTLNRGGGPASGPCNIPNLPENFWIVIKRWQAFLLIWKAVWRWLSSLLEKTQSRTKTERSIPLPPRHN